MASMACEVMPLQRYVAPIPAAGEPGSAPRAHGALSGSQAGGGRAETGVGAGCPPAAHGVCLCLESAAVRVSLQQQGLFCFRGAETRLSPAPAASAYLCWHVPLPQHRGGAAASLEMARHKPRGTPTRPSYRVIIIYLFFIAPSVLKITHASLSVLRWSQYRSLCNPRNNKQLGVPFQHHGGAASAEAGKLLFTRTQQNQN